jgi:YHS domain-containing protein
MKKIFLAAMVFLVSISAFSQEAQRKKHFNINKKGVAIDGYDPVAYFKLGKAVEGSSANAVIYEGATYYFSSVENKEEFKKHPAKYEPQYGGWCAYAMGKDGDKVEIDPGTFKIVNGKLFLFYNKYFNNTLKSWNKDEANLHARADANWKKFIQ